MNDHDKVGWLAISSFICTTIFYWLSDFNIVISSIMIGVSMFATGIIAKMYQEQYEINKQLKKIISVDAKEFLLSRKDFVDRCNYLQKCMTLYRTNREKINTIPMIGNINNKQ